MYTLAHKRVMTTKVFFSCASETCIPVSRCVYQGVQLSNRFSDIFVPTQQSMFPKECKHYAPRALWSNPFSLHLWTCQENSLGHLASVSAAMIRSSQPCCLLHTPLYRSHNSAWVQRKASSSPWLLPLYLWVGPSSPHIYFTVECDPYMTSHSVTT